MASALYVATRRFSRSFLPLLRFPNPSTSHFCSFAEARDDAKLDSDVAEGTKLETASDDAKLDSDVAEGTKPETASANPSRLLYFQRPLENGLDPGIYKAILVGKVGQVPMQKRLSSGRTVTLFSIGTGGIRNNRRPLDHEEPREYAERCAVQWHRISVYPERLGGIAMKHVKAGSILYLEGNLETKVFSDPVTGLVRRIREVAIRQDGRIVFLGNECGEQQSSPLDIKGAGYY